MKEILLIGNPNTGKTTLFNALTKSNEHVGNWHGVTVEEKRKKFWTSGEEFELVDLPGIYSLTPLSFEEQVATEYTLQNSGNLIINICDINNLRRNLYLTLQLVELGARVLLAVNNMGGKKNLAEIDAHGLERELGIKVFVFNPDNKKDIKDFKKIIKECSDNLKRTSPDNLSYIQELKNNYKFNLAEKIAKNKNYNSNFIALKILENDENIINKLEKNEKEIIKNNVNSNEIQNVAKIRYKFIDCLCKKYIKNNQKKAYGESKLDKILLNRFLCIPIFLLIMLGIFYFTFFSLGASLSAALRNFIENVVGVPLVNLISSICSVPWVIDLFANGVIGGVGSLVSFLPQVVLLFLFLSILEDSGYMARIAFCFEDIFRKLGLSGKSAYTLLMGFGCSATACLTARNMEDKNSKIKTAMLTPYMSCSAKLPIYAVLGGAFFGASNVFLVFFLYILGVTLAMLLSVILEKTVLKSKEQSFILEFPPYRVPKPSRILNLIWDNLKQFLIRIGSVLFAINIIVWLLSNFSFGFAYVPEVGGVSMLESIGRIIAPIFIPLGFGNWGASAALIAGLVAKEVIVSSIAIFNGIKTDGDGMVWQIQASITDPSSNVFFTPASAISYMVFCLIYMPCVATMSVLSKEIGIKWTLISILIEFVIAYIMSLIVFNLYGVIANFGIGWIMLVLLGVLIIAFSVVIAIKNLKNKRCGGCEKCCQVDRE